MRPVSQLITYFKQVRSELNQVTWPDQRQAIRKTTIVVVVSLLVGLYISGLDLVFTELMRVVLQK